MKLNSLIEFRSDLFFEGAVQADWFYSKEKSSLVADSFVFHGPKYFGVTSNDVKDSRLIDTASFMQKISENIYNTSEETNPFTLAIAGYGTGKSHLAVSMAKYFSNLPGDEISRNKIFANLKMADSEIANSLEIKGKKKNFVIVLNGMKDFNLNYEILKSVKLSLKLHGYSEDFLKGLSKAHEVAYGFVERNFDNLPVFLEKCRDKHIKYENSEDLKNKILDQIHDEKIFTIVDSIYENINGHKIRWDEGISANKILEKVEEELCGSRGEFNKVLIIFDEFGRFLEYASDSPQKAGDSALQQIFEAIQNKDKNIMFVGTIQSDLKSYLTRVDKTSNISRYIGRYDVSEKVYLSSNLETIFANLIEKKDDVIFENLVGEKIDRLEVDKHKKIHENLKRWIPEVSKKGVWNSWEKYSQVILKGIYPFHPVSTWLLSSLSNWMQNRSSLTLISRKIKEFEGLEIDEFGQLPLILPTNLVEGDLFTELLSAEEEGRQRSQYCIVYNNILKKYGDKLNDNSRSILIGNLILRICKFKTISKDDIFKAIVILTGINDKECLVGLELLESEYGVLQYDEASCCYDFVGDAVGQSDFRRFFKKKLQNTRLNFDSLEANSITLEKLGDIDEVETAFNRSNNISTSEWKYRGELLIADVLNEQNFKKYKQEFDKATQPDQTKGRLLWLYINKDSSDETIERLKLNSEKYFKGTPINSLVINDKENKLFETIRELVAIDNLNDNERKEFHQFIDETKNKIESRVQDFFYELKSERLGIVGSKIEPITNGRLKIFLDNQLKDLYGNIIPFPFDGFDKKTLSKAKKSFIEISQKILYSLGKEIDIKTTGQDVKNRFQAVLINSWQCVDEKSLKVIHPKNTRVSYIYEKINNLLTLNNDSLPVKDILKILQKPPYGLNDYSSSLLLFTYIANREYETRIKFNGKLYNLVNWAENIINKKGNDLEFRVLENSEINIVDTGEEDSKLRKLLNEINANSDIERVEYLEGELNKILSVMSVEGDLSMLVNVRYSRVETGKKLKEDFTRKIASLKYSLDDSLRDLTGSVYNLVKIIKDLDKNERELEDNYLYTDLQSDQFSKLEFQAKEILNKVFEKWLIKVDCREVGRISSFEKTHQRLGKDLSKLGYTVFQQKLISRVNSVIKNQERIAEYQHLEEIINKFISENLINSYTKYTELKSLEEKGKNYLGKIDSNNNIFEEDKLELKKKLKVKIKEVESSLNIINQEMELIYDLIEEAKNMEDLSSVIEKIQIIKNRGLEDGIFYEFNEIGSFIAKFQNDLIEIEKQESRDDVSSLELKVEYINEDYGFDFKEILDCFIKAIINNLNKKSKEWSEKYLNLNISEAEINDLKIWEKETEILPKFLLEEDILKFREVKKEVKEKLSEDKINYILGLISELSPIEKEKIKIKIA